MTDVATLIADMVRAGVDPDLIGRAAAALSKNVQNVQVVQDATADRRRAYDRERKAKSKAARSTGIPPESADSTGATPLSPKERFPTPPKEITPIPVSEPIGSSTASASNSKRNGLSEFRAVLSEHLGHERLEAFIQNRKSKRAAFTAHAANLFLSDATSVGMSPSDAADLCISRNWITVKPEYLRGPARTNGAPPGRRMNAVEALASLRSRERTHEPTGPIIDHRNAELFRTDEPKLRGLLSDAGAAMRWPDGSGHH